MRRRLTAILALAPLAGLTGTTTRSEIPAPGAARAELAAGCPCPALLEMTIRKVEETYIGYRLEIGEAERPGYEARKETSRGAARAPGADCFLVIRDWVDGFDDAHLFLLESPDFSAAQLDSLRRSAVHTQWTEASFRAELARRAADLDPIEGVWYGKSGRYGIVRSSEAGTEGGADATFTAVVLETAEEGWTAGEEKARFIRRGDGYDVVYRTSDHSTRRYEARLHRGSFLVMPAGIGWAKTDPLPAGARAMDPGDPMAPTLDVLPGGVVLVSVPSHDPGYRARLDSLVTAHEDRLLASPLLIVDVRGNGGGSSLTTRPLMPFIYRTPERDDVPGPDGDPVVLASADNLAYFSRWKRGDETPDWLLDLLGRMGRSYGEIVPFQDPPDTTRGWLPGVVHPTPPAVAVLQDRGAGSAAEAFVIFARHSPRVTTFGEPTRGMIDYQNVGIVRVGCPDAGLLLGYPTIAASASLPEGGLNPTGIPPDVSMEVTGDMIGRVVRWYAVRDGTSR